MFGITHCHLPVSNLERSQDFYSSGMGFEILSAERITSAQSDMAEAITLDALGVRLCLVFSEAEIAAHTLAFQTMRIELAVDRLTKAGAVLEKVPQRTQRHHLEAILRDPDGHRLRLWRQLREDEYEREPDLPTLLPWDEDAQDLLKSFLRKTPVLFRDVARKGCVREAEFLTPRDSSVHRHTVARAVIRATPRMLRSRVRKPLLEHGFDLDDFAEDFSV